MSYFARIRSLTDLLVYRHIGRSVADHVEGPVFVDDDSLGDRCTVHVDDPEQSRETGARSDLTRHPHVLVSAVS